MCLKKFKKLKNNFFCGKIWLKNGAEMAVALKLVQVPSTGMHLGEKCHENIENQNLERKRNQWPEHSGADVS